MSLFRWCRQPASCQRFIPFLLALAVCLLFPLIGPQASPDEVTVVSLIPENDYIFLPFRPFSQMIAPGLEVRGKFTKELVDREGKVHDPKVTPYEIAKRMINRETTELWLINNCAPEAQPELLLQFVVNGMRHGYYNDPPNHFVRILDVRCDGESIILAWAFREVTFERLNKKEGRWQSVESHKCKSCSSSIRSFAESGTYYVVRSRLDKPMTVMLGKDGLVEVMGEDPIRGP